MWPSGVYIGICYEKSVFVLSCSSFSVLYLILLARPSLFVLVCAYRKKWTLPTYQPTHLPISLRTLFFLFTPSLAYLLAHRLSGSQSCVRMSLATLKEQGLKSTPQATWCTSATWVSWLRKENHPRQSCGVTMGNGLETSSNAVSVWGVFEQVQCLVTIATQWCVSKYCMLKAVRNWSQHWSYLKEREE